jgi:hypothetical protein
MRAPARAEPLGEVAHPQLLEQPRDLAQRRRQRAAAAPSLDPFSVGLLELVDRGHAVAVGGDVVGEALEAALGGAQVALDVGQTARRRRGDEASEDEAAELACDVEPGGLEGGRTQALEAALDVAPGLEDAHDGVDHRRGTRGQLRADGRAQAPEAGLVPRGPAGLIDEGVDGGGERVVEHSAGVPAGRGRQRELGRGAQPRAQVAQRRGQREQEQAARPRAHRRRLRGGRLERAHAHRVALVHQRGIGAHGAPAPGQRDDARERSHAVPVAQPVALEARGCRPELGAQARAQLGPQRVEVAAGREHGATVVLDAEAHAQVRGERPEVEVLGGDANAADALERRGERVGQRARGGVERRLERRHRRGHRDEPATDVLRERPHEGGDELRAQGGHEPLEALGAEPAERAQRDVDGDAVVLGAGLEAVAQRQLEVSPAPGVGAAGVVDVAADEELARQVEELGPARALVAPPAVEVRARDDAGWHALVEERVEHFVAGEQAAAASALLGCLDLGDPGAVAGGERVARVPVAGHERAAQEELAGAGRVGAGEAHGAPGDDRQPVERDALGRHGRGAAAVPARLGDAAARELPGHGLDPGRVDRRGHAAPQPRGLDELGDHDPRRRAAREQRPGPQREARAARAEVLARVAGLQPEVREQPGEHRAVDVVGRGGHAVDRDARLARGLAQLGDEVLPLAHAQCVEEVLAAPAAKRAARELALAGSDGAPQLEQRERV